MRKKSFLALAIISLGMNSLVFAQDATTAANPGALAAASPANPPPAPWKKRDFGGLVAGATGKVEVKGSEKFTIYSNAKNFVTFKTGDQVRVTLGKIPNVWANIFKGSRGRMLYIEPLSGGPKAAIKLGGYRDGPENFDVRLEGKNPGEGTDIIVRSKIIDSTPIKNVLHHEACKRLGIRFKGANLVYRIPGVITSVFPTSYLVQQIHVTVRSMKTGNTLEFSSDPEAIEAVSDATYQSDCR